MASRTDFFPPRLAASQFLPYEMRNNLALLNLLAPRLQSISTHRCYCSKQTPLSNNKWFNTNYKTIYRFIILRRANYKYNKIKLQMDLSIDIMNCLIQADVKKNDRVMGVI